MHVALTPVTLLERSALAYPQAAALVQGEDVLSFGQLLKRCRQLAQALVRLQVQGGDRVAVLSENNCYAAQAHFGVPGAGAVLVMLNPWLAEADLIDLVQFSEAKVLIAEAKLYNKLSAAGQVQLLQATKVLLVGHQDKLPAGCLDYDSHVDAEDGSVALDAAIDDEHRPIAINFTSGTTGRPKGVVYSHRAGYLHALGQVLMLGMTRQSRYLWTLPIFHVNGWGHMWAAAAIGCPQILPAHHLDRADSAEFSRLVREHGITHLAGAPRLIKMLIEHPESAAALRGLTMVTGGSAPAPVLIQRLEELGVNLVHQYGLNETCGPYVVCEPQDDWSALEPAARAALRARQGVASIHAGTGLQVRDTDGHPVPPDGRTMGEIVMRGNTVALGYFKNPEASAKAFRDGWFHSGDMAVVHPDGALEIRDRIKDLIYVETPYGWENVSSIEIENVICRHPQIQDAAVIAVPDPAGETKSPLLVAFLELQPQAQLSAEQFHEYCAGALSVYLRPQVVMFEPLPKTNTGKVRKELLQRQARERLAEQFARESAAAIQA